MHMQNAGLLMMRFFFLRISFVTLFRMSLNLTALYLWGQQICRLSCATTQSDHCLCHFAPQNKLRTKLLSFLFAGCPANLITKLLLYM